MAVERGGPRSAAFQADLAALRRPPVDFWPSASVQSRLVCLVLRKPVRTLSPAQVPLAWSTTLAMRLLLPVTVTTLAGAWADAGDQLDDWLAGVRADRMQDRSEPAT